MGQKIVKLFVWVLAIYAIYLAYTVVADYYAVKNFSERKDFNSANDILEYTRIAELAYRNDNYGSTTPEGTLELFVTALEAGNTDLAANYFAPEKVKQMKGDLKAGMKSGGIDTLLNYMSKFPQNKFYYGYENLYEFSWRDNGGVSAIVRIKLNKYTNKWLVESI